MSTNVNKIRHLSMDSRRRLIRLRNALVWLLDEDRRFGFDECIISYKLGPYLLSALTSVWCKPLRTVVHPFKPVDSLDRTPTVFVRLDEYERLRDNCLRLNAENVRLRKQLGFSSSDDLPF